MSTTTAPTLWNSLKTYNMDWTLNTWKNNSDTAWIQTLQKVVKCTVIPFLMLVAFELLLKNLILVTLVRCVVGIGDLVGRLRPAPPPTPIATPIPPPAPAAPAPPPTLPAAPPELPAPQPPPLNQPAPLPLHQPALIDVEPVVPDAPLQNGRPLLLPDELIPEPLLAAPPPPGNALNPPNGPENEEPEEQPAPQPQGPTFNRLKAAGLASALYVAGGTAVTTLGFPLLAAVAAPAAGVAAIASLILHNADQLAPPPEQPTQTPSRLRNVLVYGRDAMYNRWQSVKGYFWD